jgi:hypothetical protein
MTVYYVYGAEKPFLLCAGTAEPDEFSPAEPVDCDGFSSSCDFCLSLLIVVEFKAK